MPGILRYSRRRPCALTLTLLSTFLCVTRPAFAEDSAACAIRTERVAIAGSQLAYNRVDAPRQLTPEKPLVILLHGLFASKEQWSAMLCQLQNLGLNVLAPDLPGYGESTGFTVQAYPLEAQVEQLHAFIQSVQQGAGAVHLAGNSMGGAIAALYARRFPGQVKSLTLIGAPLGVADWSPEVRKLLARGQNPLIPLTIDAFEQELALLLAKPPALPTAVKARRVAEYQTSRVHYETVWQIVNRYHGALCTPPQPTGVPTLVLWGGADRIFRPVSPERIARCLPGSELVVLEGEGHLPHLESAAKVTDRFHGFLQGMARGDSAR